MKGLLAIIIPIVIVVGTTILLWKRLFKPFLELQGKISDNIREKIFPDIYKSNNTITSLSAAAIVLTFSILEIVSEKIIFYKGLLIISWISFSLTVLLGVTIGVLSYITRAQYKVAIFSVKEYLESQDDSTEGQQDNSTGKNARLYLGKATELQRILILSLSAQAILFMSGIMFVTSFAIMNV